MACFPPMHSEIKSELTKLNIDLERIIDFKKKLPEKILLLNKYLDIMDLQEKSDEKKEIIKSLNFTLDNLIEMRSIFDPNGSEATRAFEQSRNRIQVNKHRRRIRGSNNL